MKRIRLHPFELSCIALAAMAIALMFVAQGATAIGYTLAALALVPHAIAVWHHYRPEPEPEPEPDSAGFQLGWDLAARLTHLSNVWNDLQRGVQAGARAYHKEGRK